ncbi:MAG: bi-domain-containing oxidoreductase [Chitinophagales bacterium]|nr:bi-domain-containing oxidoreductase [Chitinophagales bacterium]
MKQALIKKGKVLGEIVPSPLVSEGSVLIKVVNSCISAGTELSSIANSKKPLIKKALEQPEQIRAVIDFARNNGIQKTIERIKGVTDGGKPIGYSLSGIVVGVGKNVDSFCIGDHVAAAGAGLANHAEFVDVPENLVMKMPLGMPFDKASTVTLGGIALQGVRRADMRLGETCVVVGAGILGLLAQQMLQLSGIRVIVLDLDEKRLEIAKNCGASLTLNPSKDDALKTVETFTEGYGADAVLFTAATGSSEPLSQAFKMCKRKGKVILVGVVGMEIKREDIYAKELDFLISTSYGPGRYDNNYEQKGLDYPFAYVRWTENRNMTEYLKLVHENRIQLDALINKVYSIQDVEKAYESLTGADKPIIALLSYDHESIKQLNTQSTESEYIFRLKDTSIQDGIINVGIIGAGAFATGMHLPNLKSLQNKYKITAIHTRTGSKAKAIAEQFNADYATTDINQILQDSKIHLVIICTRHDSHAELALKALEAGKHVFVEKPLATKQEDLNKLKAFFDADNSPKPMLFVGFNRRFSKSAQTIKKQIKGRLNPLFIHYRMNAGYIPQESWIHEDGGRIIGEGCHIIDLMNFFTESKINSISFESLSPANSKYSSNDNKQIILKYEDGSVCSIHYFAVGNKSISKEYMEIHFDEKTIVMDDYKSLKGYGINIPELNSSISDKGQADELLHIHDYLTKKSSKPPIEFWDLVQTTEISFAIAEN